MPKIIFINGNGTQREVIAELGQSLMQVAVNAGIEGIVAECGGACACGTCHCYIAKTWVEMLTAPQEPEADMLEFVIDPKRESRLSCQVPITPEMDGLVVHIPVSQT